MPGALCLCEDASVIGTPFYCMAFVSGRVFVDPALPELAPSGRAKVYSALATTLAQVSCEIEPLPWRRLLALARGTPEAHCFAAPAAARRAARGCWPGRLRTSLRLLQASGLRRQMAAKCATSQPAAPKPVATLTAHKQPANLVPRCHAGKALGATV